MALYSCVYGGETLRLETEHGKKSSARLFSFSACGIRFTTFSLVLDSSKCILLKDCVYGSVNRGLVSDMTKKRLNVVIFSYSAAY